MFFLVSLFITPCSVLLQGLCSAFEATLTQITMKIFEKKSASTLWQHSTFQLFPLSTSSSFIVSIRTWKWYQSAHLTLSKEAKKTIAIMSNYFFKCHLQSWKTHIWCKSTYNLFFILLNKIIIDYGLHAFRKSNKNQNSKGNLFPHQKTIRRTTFAQSMDAKPDIFPCIPEKQNCHKQRRSPSQTVSTAYRLPGGGDWEWHHVKPPFDWGCQWEWAM